MDGYMGGGGDTTRRRGSSRTGSSRTGAPSLEGAQGGLTNRRRRGTSRGRTTEQGLGGPGMEGYMMGGLPGDRLTRRGPSMYDVYDELDKIQLTGRTLLEKM